MTFLLGKYVQQFALRTRDRGSILGGSTVRFVLVAISHTVVNCIVLAALGVPYSLSYLCVLRCTNAGLIIHYRRC